MAFALRLRRAAVALSSSLLKDHRGLSTIPSSPPRLPLSEPSAAPPLLGNPSLRAHSLIQSQSFRSSPPASSGRRTDLGGEKEIDPNEILFEGCDYNHWLITMDFPKDPKPTPEEMVETYVQTLAKVVGSVEEAKKRMYACSTTTYHGFQAVMTEEMSEKFRGLPGVVFILPDSYIDPVNKEYGGDKYDNGVITPRPPPIQYRPQGRYGDRNRNYSQPRYNGQRDPMPAQQGYPPQDRQPPMQGDGRSYTPQQNYGPPGQDGRGYGPPGHDGRGYGPPGQDGRGYGPPGQDGRGYGPPGQDGRGYGPPGGRDFAPSGEGRDFGQGERRDYTQAGGRDFNQGQRGNYAPQEQRNFTQGQGGDYRHPGPSGSGDHSQGSSSGNNGEYRQGPSSSYSGDNRQGAGPVHSGQYSQGSGSGYGQNYPGPVEGQNESWQGRR